MKTFFKGLLAVCAVVLIVVGITIPKGSGDDVFSINKNMPLKIFLIFLGFVLIVVAILLFVYPLIKKNFVNSVRKQERKNNPNIDAMSDDEIMEQYGGGEYEEVNTEFNEEDEFDAFAEEDEFDGEVSEDFEIDETGTQTYVNGKDVSNISKQEAKGSQNILNNITQPKETTYVECAYCGTNNESTAKKCDSCGANLRTKR